jgi:hypothetical protein
MLQRQLDIQRQFLREQEKLDKAYNSDRLSLTAEAAVIRKAQYDQDTASLQTSLNNSLDIERKYQERRAAMLSDWRNGINSGWADYVAAAGRASEQSAGLALQGNHGVPGVVGDDVGVDAALPHAPHLLHLHVGEGLELRLGQVAVLGGDADVELGTCIGLCFGHGRISSRWA